MEKLRTCSMTVIRFGMNEKGVRPPKEGDPLVNRRGRCIGWVTSCVADSQGYLVGMAYVDERHAEVESKVGIFNLRRKPKEEVANIQLGDQVLLHNWATILPRFAMRD
jgi:glycine hydroxymethyltransferase